MPSTAQMALMVINADSGVWQRIAGFAHEAGKGMIIVVNKWDTIEKDNHTAEAVEDDARDQSTLSLCADIPPNPNNAW